MRHFNFVKITCWVVVVAMPPAAAQSGVHSLDTQTMAARTELVAIDTLTLSDAQFLTGDSTNAKNVERSTSHSARLRTPAARRVAARLWRDGSQHRDVVPPV